MDDQAGFDAFYISSRARLLRQLTAMTADPELAKDALQEAYERAWQRWRRVRGSALGVIVTAVIATSVVLFVFGIQTLLTEPETFTAILAVLLAANTMAWRLGPGGSWSRLRPRPQEPERTAQERFMDRARLALAPGAGVPDGRVTGRRRTRLGGARATRRARPPAGRAVPAARGSGSLAASPAPRMP